MAHIKTDEGLDVPVKGKPEGGVQALPPAQEVSLSLEAFHDVKFRLLKKAGDTVRIGDPVAEDKGCPGRYFVAPGAGKIKEVRRGLKRRLLDVVIELEGPEEYKQYELLDPRAASGADMAKHLSDAGLFAHIRRRPFNLLANPNNPPRAIFVKAIESAPFVAPAELQVRGFEREFQAGVTALSKMTEGKVHLVYRAGTDCEAFTTAVDCERHTAEGQHPVGNSSVHIHYIDPISTCEERVWTCTAHDCVCIGDLLLNGRYHIQRVVAIGGPGVLPEMTGFFNSRAGAPISNFVASRNKSGLQRFISGDLLMGRRVEVDDFLGFYDFGFNVVPESVDRELLHFFRLGLNKFSATDAYLSGKVGGDRTYDFTTSAHGEERPYIDGRVYDRVMPMQIPVMELCKALIGQDYDTAEELGLLEVAPEDFALPTFICPSKIEMTELVHDGLTAYAAEVLD